VTTADAIGQLVFLQAKVVRMAQDEFGCKLDFHRRDT
jgi:hypothetical protein